VDVIVVRELGVPPQPELAMGAVGEGGVWVINRQVVHRARVSGGGAGAAVVSRGGRPDLARPQLAAAGRIRTSAGNTPPC